MTLAEAGSKATDARRLILDGQDPLVVRAQANQKRVLKPTLAVIAERYIAEQSPGWRDIRSAPIWRSTLGRYVYPKIGSRPIDAVTTEDILGILRPIWGETTETASRIRGRLERILDYARSHGLAEGKNPARWGGWSALEKLVRF